MELMKPIPEPGTNEIPLLDPFDNNTPPPGTVAVPVDKEVIEGVAVQEFVVPPCRTVFAPPIEVGAVVIPKEVPAEFVNAGVDGDEEVIQ